MNIVITGSSSGIGAALTKHFLALGHRVWGLARSKQQTPEGAERLFTGISCDVADVSQVERAAAQVGTETGSIDALVTCAGLQGAVGPAVTLDPEAWSKTVRVNLDGTFYAIRCFYPLLKACPRRAKVVCFSGGGATKARPNFSAYGVAKAGVVRLVETIAEEAKNEPLDINAVAPGAINTRLTEEVLALGAAVVGEAEFNAAKKQMETGGGSMAKVLGLMDVLLSPRSDGVSGRLLSAPWDPWQQLERHAAALAKSDIYMLRRIVPEERGQRFD